MPTDIHRTIDQALEAFRIDDALLAQAYDAMPPALRARLKTAIAFQYHLNGEAPAWETRRVHRPTAGFCHTVHEKPAAWTVAVIETDFNSPARLLAALMPAVLAGVERIFVVSFGAPPDDALLVALELAGLEDIFVLPPCAVRQQRGVDPLQLLVTLFDESPDGRLLLFPATHSRTSPIFADLARIACHLRLPVWQDASPRLLVRHTALVPAADMGIGGINMTMENFLHWAHGNTFVKTEPSETLEPEAECPPKFARPNSLSSPDPEDCAKESMDEICLYDACYTGQADIAAPSASCALTLGLGMEACWESLPKDFFRTHTISACLATLPQEH